MRVKNIVVEIPLTFDDVDDIEMDAFPSPIFINVLETVGNFVYYSFFCQICGQMRILSNPTSFIPTIKNPHKIKKFKRCKYCNEVTQFIFDDIELKDERNKAEAVSG